MPDKIEGLTLSRSVLEHLQRLLRLDRVEAATYDDGPRLRLGQRAEDELKGRYDAHLGD